MEAVLANDGVLQPGDYPAQFRICGSDGTSGNEGRPRTSPAAGRARPPIGGAGAESAGHAECPRGAYELSRTWSGRRAARKILAFNVSSLATLPKLDQRVTAWGIDDRVKTWLKRHGIISEPLDGPAPGRREMILVGDLSKPGSDASEWKELAQRMARGSAVMFLSPAASAREGSSGLAASREERAILQVRRSHLP